MRRRDLALSYCRARPLQQMIMKFIKQLNVSFYLKPTKIVVIKSLFQINKINEIKIFLFAWDEKLWSQNLFIDIWAHMPMQYAYMRLRKLRFDILHICTAGHFVRSWPLKMGNPEIERNFESELKLISGYMSHQL